MKDEGRKNLKPDIRKPVTQNRLLRRAVAVAIALAFVTVGFYWVKMRRRREVPARIAEKLPAGVNQQLSGYTFTRSVGGRQIFTVHAAKTLAYKKGGTTVLEDVSVELFGREGNRHDLLRTESCDYGQQSGALACGGKVEIELDAPSGAGNIGTAPSRIGPAPGTDPLRASSPAYIETSNVSYQPQGSLLETDRPVEWRLGSASGSAIGLTYATKDEWLELNSSVRASMPSGNPSRARPGGRGQTLASSTLQLSASALRYTKATREVDLRGPVEITEGDGRVLSAEATISLDAKHRVRWAVLEGGVRASDSDGGGELSAHAARVRADLDPDGRELRKITAQGRVEAESRRAGPRAGVNHLAAQELTVNFSGRHSNPTTGTATGSVVLSSEPGAEPAAKPDRSFGTSRALRREALTADGINFKFRPRTSILQQATTVGPGKLVLQPADRAQGERTVTAGRFLMSFDVRSRLESVEGLSPTQMVVEQSTARGAPMVTSGDRLSAAFDPSTGSLRNVTQSGQFHFQEGNRQATADEAQYAAETQLLTLTGRPLVWEPDGRVRADRMRMSLATSVAEGIGHVQSSHLDHEKDSRALAASRPSVPSRADETPASARVTNVLADRVEVNRRNELARYTGHVRAWRGDEVIEAPSLDIDWKNRRITAARGVVTSDLQPSSLPVARTASTIQSAGREKAGATRPVTIKADHLEYLDSERRASYVGHVRLESEDATLEADRLDAYFSGVPGEGEARIERVTADGHVVVTEPHRRATGDHAEYLAAAGRIVMTGGPPTLYDAETGFATGERLTFSIHDDTLLVDGGGKSRAFSQHRIVP